jgi:hypothetical protein
VARGRLVDRAACALLAALACSCGAAPAASPPAPAPRAAALARALDVGPPSPPRQTSRALAISLRHTRGELRVEINATAPSGELREWSAPPASARDVQRRVDAGAWHEASGASPIEASATSVTVRFSVAPSRELSSRVDGAAVDARGFRAVGAHALALPRAFEGATVDATISIATDVGDVAVVGSSYGVGAHREVKTTGAALRRAVFASGPGGRAELHAPEGHDDALWFGYTAFDPRAVVAEVAGFRTTLHEYFHGAEPEPATLILATDARPAGRFHVARVTRGVVGLVSGLDRWDGALRLAVATELVHAWIGDRLWLGPADGGADRVWFHDGVARAIARDELFRVGLLTPDEYLEEVSMAIAQVVASPHRGDSNDALAQKIDAPRVRALLVARGALYGATVRARIAKATKGQKSLRDVARALYGEAALRRGPIDASSWLAAVSALTSADEARRDFTRAIVEGAAEGLPADALGPCFEPTRARFETRDLGFDQALSRATGELRGVEKDGPAAKAGLAEGEGLLDVKFLPMGHVTVRVARGGAQVDVSVTPRVQRGEGQGFRRRAGVKDDACR